MKRKSSPEPLIIAVTAMVMAAVALVAVVALLYPVSEYPPSDYVEGPPAYVESIDIRIMESFPVQVSVVAKGDLPNPCTRIGRIDVARTIYGDFQITINTLKFSSDSGACAAEVVVPFEENIPLDVTGHRAGIYRVTFNNPDGSTTSASFELQQDNFNKALRACSEDSECEVPMHYAIRSNCPFGAACVNDECRVVCPLTYHDPDPNVSKSYPFTCEAGSDCDCTERGELTLECACLDSKCVSVEY
jgi:inhibitor of cysteine peptidase